MFRSHILKTKIPPSPQYWGRRYFSIEPQTIVMALGETLQAVHATSGLPWWAVIPLSTFALRTVWTLPLSILQRKRLQKQSEYKAIISGTTPVLKLNLGQRAQETRNQLAAPSSSDSERAVQLQSPLANIKYEEILLLSAKETRKRQKALFKKHKIQLWKNFVLPVFQVPLWISLSLTMRNLCGWLSWDSLANQPLDPGLYTEGLLWFSDLTSYDHYHLTPVILGVISLCNVEWSFKTFELSRLASRPTLRPTLADAFANLSRMGVVFMMAIAMNAPVGLTLFWISSQTFSLAQNVVLDMAFPVAFTPRTRVAPSVASTDSTPIVNRRGR
ncbi:Cytochrome c oxidase assembly protein cox18, mitochondrial [Yamadazyma tenuis]|uniref:Membrane insertase YidC/Oxa/ALB C-terminal domain-containing protein n=1 Tax=Candida tenuis (strain ATCC 10573 / BCRC 21748 / CBS 615 / JCM 9827 / NBRC 10315 / NRRL Y-1498 / VKM Y-70) TaxID=590646 RepID=G3AWC0_CANTC|nr:uncharacterized protein CANTEDRAFT_117455 [Yamadazyma tenuis ATCC 10573]EGV66507.1 hypothetical protein CANTEDRAFT_117455 [Yamadazyma tenuis ATCC 10573]WEJ95381.1 Cytochrome c oxidase assembly protein cox18, mitochondrial [Yamadazyma tenuis]